MRRRSYEVEGLLERIRDLRDRLDTAIARAEKAEEQRDRARRHVTERGHVPACEQLATVFAPDGPKRCDCGFVAALVDEPPQGGEG